MIKSSQNRGKPIMSKYSIIALLEAVKIISGLVDSPEQVAKAADQIQKAVANSPRTDTKEKSAQGGNLERSEQFPN